MNIDTITNQKSIVMDLIKANEDISASICSVGFDAKVALKTSKYKRLPFCHGKMSYNLAVIECLLNSIGNRLEIEIDGTDYSGNYLLMCIANGTTYGGGFRSAPEAKVDDGLLDVVLVKNISRFLISKLVAKYSKGEHIKNGEVVEDLKKYITYIKARNIKIKSKDKFVANVDGECSEKTLFDVAIQDKKLKFLIP